MGLSALGAAAPVAGGNNGLHKLGVSAPYETGVVPLIKLPDRARNKELQVRAFYPKAEGRFPVILFSHLGDKTGARDEYDRLVGFWTAQGYVCLLPDHDKITPLGKPDPARTGQKFEKDWRDRPLDLQLLLDSLSELDRTIPELTGKLNQNAIGAGGHYVGAFTAGLLGGAKTFAPSGESATFVDHRIRAVLMLSPTGREGGRTEKSWSDIKLPMLVMTGSNDPSTRTENPPEWRTEPFQFASPGNKYLVFIEGLDGTYGGMMIGENAAKLQQQQQQWAKAQSSRDGGSPDRNSNPDELAHYVQASTLAFWDAHLKNNEEAHAYLESDRLPVVSQGKVELRRK